MLSACARSVRLNFGGLSLSFTTPINRNVVDVLQILCLHHTKHDEARLVDFVHWLRVSYDIIPYSDAIDMINQNQVSGRFVSITFDDGLMTHFHAAKVLADLGVSACFFVCPGVIREIPSIEPKQFFRTRLLMNPKELMSWSHLHQLHKLGHEIGSHTLTHPNLRLLRTDIAQYEIHQSKAEIESELGVCKHFAWPYGQVTTMSDALIRFAHDIGYASVASAVPGDYHPLKALSHVDPWIHRVPLEIAWTKRSVRYLLRISE